MKAIFTLCALTLLVVPAVGCAEKKQYQAAHINPDVFSAEIDDPRYAAEVAVLTPDNRFLYLKQPNLDCSGVDFSAAKLTIDLAVAVGAEWIDGKPKIGYAFEKAGSYKILTGDNLETELDNSYSRVFKVSFSPKKNSKHRIERKDVSCRINGENFALKLQ